MRLDDAIQDLTDRKSKAYLTHLHCRRDDRLQPIFIRAELLYGLRSDINSKRLIDLITDLSPESRYGEISDHRRRHRRSVRHHRWTTEIIGAETSS